MTDSGTPSAVTVSVLTPAFNAARFIGQTIGSVREQTFDDWEMIVVDDASTDDTAAIVAELADQDPRIVLVPSGENQGPAAARILGLSRARGRYIALLDADDLWLPEKLTRQLAFMAETGCAVSFTAYRRVSEDGRRCGRLIHAPERVHYRQLLRHTAIANLTAMIDRTRTGDFSFLDITYDDYALWLSFLRRGLSFRGLDRDLARFRVVRQSHSSNKLRSATWVWNIYRRHEQLGLLESSWSLCNYAVRAAIKRLGGP